MKWKLHTELTKQEYVLVMLWSVPWFLRHQWSHFQSGHSFHTPVLAPLTVMEGVVWVDGQSWEVVVTWSSPEGHCALGNLICFSDWTTVQQALAVGGWTPTGHTPWSLQVVVPAPPTLPSEGGRGWGISHPRDSTTPSQGHMHRQPMSTVGLKSQRKKEGGKQRTWKANITKPPKAASQRSTSRGDRPVIGSSSGQCDACLTGEEFDWVVCVCVCVCTGTWKLGGLGTSVSATIWVTDGPALPG